MYHQSLIIVGWIGCIIILLASIVATFASKEHFTEVNMNNDPDRRFLFYANRNILIYTIIKNAFFNGGLDTLVHRNSIAELRKKAGFVPFGANYDVICDKTQHNGNADIKDFQQYECTAYDFQSFAIPETKTIPTFTNSDSIFNMYTDANSINTVINIDNNYYNFTKSITVFRGVDIETVEVQLMPPFSGKKRYISVGLKDGLSPWFVLARPVLLYIEMVGYVKVIYDVLSHTNVMNFYSTSGNGSAQRLYLELLPAKIKGRDIVMHKTFDLTNERVNLLKSQIEGNNIMMFYLKPSLDAPIAAPLEFATVISCSLNTPQQQEFDLSGPVNDAYENKVVLYRSVSDIVIEIGGQPIVSTLASQNDGDSTFASFAANELGKILKSQLVTSVNVIIAFNTVTIIVFYKDESNQQSLYVYRTVLGGVLKDKCIAVSSNLTSNNQLPISYIIPSLTDLAIGLNFQ